MMNRAIFFINHHMMNQHVNRLFASETHLTFRKCSEVFCCLTFHKEELYEKGVQACAVV